MTNNNLNAGLQGNEINDKTSLSLPKHINLDKWEDVGYVWSGLVTPEFLDRVSTLVPDNYQNNPIEVTCELFKNGQLLNFKMQFSGNIWTTCQRCLQPLEVDVSHHTQIYLLESEDQLSLIEESDDYVVLDELLENIPQKKQTDRLLPLSRLVEDELLLDIPLSVKHDDCEMMLEQVGVEIEEENENPFAALAELKGKL